MKQHQALGVVSGTSPITVDMLGARITLDDDDLRLAASVREYDNRVGIAIGDTVVLHRIGEDGDWLITAVESDTDPSDAGVSSVVEKPLASTTVGRVVVGKLAVTDADGNTVGWVPVYDAL
jgi:hypothetical protein